jgi:hypothetical protein
MAQDRVREVGFDDTVPLHCAADLFPADGVPPQSLRTEIRKGNLLPERIAGHGHHEPDHMQEARDAI